MSPNEWLVLIWLTVLGSCVGSFLNVVVYRLPRGGSLLGRSQCPKCQHPIRAYHNVPVFGWLMVRGKCHDCAQRISARYPLVEAATAAVFAALFFAAVKFGDPADRGLAHETPWALFFAAAVCCSALICELLIRWDGQRVPGSIRWTATISAIACGLLLTLL